MSKFYLGLDAHAALLVSDQAILGERQAEEAATASRQSCVRAAP